MANPMWLLLAFGIREGVVIPTDMGDSVGCPLIACMVLPAADMADSRAPA